MRSPRHALVLLAAAALACGKGDGAPLVPASPRIVFQSSRLATGSMHVFIMDQTGTSVQQLASGTDSVDQSPTFSKDGARVAFSSNRSGHFALYIVNASGTGLTPVVMDTNENLSPAWSPDGTRLAFVRETHVGTGNGIWVVNANGTGLAPLTNTPGDAEPSWSPDGLTIAFTRAGDVWKMDATGANPVQLTTSPAAEGQPAWSPDGSVIAFTSAATGSQQLMRMSPTGTNAGPLIPGATLPAAEPAWSPDGQSVAYVSTRLGTQQIYRRKVDGTGTEQPLTNAGAFNSHPSWR